MRDQIEWASSRLNSERLNGHALLFITSIMIIKLEMIGWEFFPHSYQKLFRLLIIVEIDEWDINFIPILFKRDMDF